MNADTLASARAAIERDRETEAAMTPGEWAVGRTDMTTETTGEDGEWYSVHYVYRPGSDPSETGGEWVPRIGVMGDECLEDAAGIARARNRWPLYLALAEACVALEREKRIDDITNIREYERVHDAYYAALAALAEQEPTP